MVTIAVGMVTPNVATADDRGRSTDAVYVNPFDIPCDGVEYAVRNGYMADYTVKAGIGSHIEVGDTNKHTFAATSVKETTNTITDTHSVSLKLAAKLIGDVTGELGYTNTRSVSTADKVSFSTSDTLPIASKGGYILAVPEYVKTQASADYWTRSPGDSCRPSRTKDRMSIDAVTSMGWKLMCDTSLRPCVAGVDYTASTATTPPPVSNPKTNVFLQRNGAPVTMRHVEGCAMKYVWYPERKLCDFMIPSHCSVDLRDFGVTGIWDYRAKITCPDTVPFRAYRIIGVDYHVNSVEGKWPWDNYNFKAVHEARCVTGEKACDWGKVALYDSWVNRNRQTVNLVIPIY